MPAPITLPQLLDLTEEYMRHLVLLADPAGTATVLVAGGGMGDEPLPEGSFLNCSYPILHQTMIAGMAKLLTSAFRSDHAVLAVVGSGMAVTTNIPEEERERLLREFKRDRLSETDRRKFETNDHVIITGQSRSGEKLIRIFIIETDREGCRILVPMEESWSKIDTNLGDLFTENKEELRLLAQVAMMTGTRDAVEIMGPLDPEAGRAERAKLTEIARKMRRAEARHSKEG